MIKISREYWFSAAHQLVGHPKCGRLHGHNYRVVVTLLAEPDEVNGMVMDYSDLDAVVKPVIDGILDHRYLVSDANIDNSNPLLGGDMPDGWFAFLPILHSTAECLAEYLFLLFEVGLPALHSVQVDETPKSVAIYTRED